MLCDLYRESLTCANFINKTYFSIHCVHTYFKWYYLTIRFENMCKTRVLKSLMLKSCVVVTCSSIYVLTRVTMTTI